MSAKHLFKFDESKLRPKQREAAIAMVEREFAPKHERKTLEQITKEVGICDKTLYNWNHRDDNFIAYKNYLASQFIDTHLAFVYRKLIDAIDRGSVKGIELFLKRIGDLAEQSEITIRQGDADQPSFEERKAELLKRLEGGGDDSGVGR